MVGLVFSAIIGVAALLVAAMVRFIIISVDASIVLTAYCDIPEAEANWIGAGFAMRNYFKIKNPFNPFKAFSRGFGLTWEDLDNCRLNRRL